MKVVVVGSGGREHALAMALARTADEVLVAPGNPGIPGSTPVAPEDLEADLFVVGPEVPLVDGLADRLRAQGKLVFGPGWDGAQLEGSKAWMKQLLVQAAVPTARHATFTGDSQDLALAYLKDLPGLYVVKTDGLAAGKGVVVTESLDEASDAVRSYLSGDAFGDAGRTLVIEEGMTGPELSVFAVCDGKQAVLFGSAQDFKRVGDADAGPNTGGMGAYAPVPFVGDDVLGTVMDRAILPTLDALQRQGIDYRGVLYCGLMLTTDGPKVIEYNIRFGDPEAQVLFPRVRSDLVDLFAQAASGSLANEVAFDDTSAVCLVLACEGYPAAPRTGDLIEGLDALAGRDDLFVFCAGVARDEQDRLVTAGGRALNVVGTGPDLASARSRAYDGASRIDWPGVFYRTDIAKEASLT